MLGLVLSGATAIPLTLELDWLASHQGVVGADSVTGVASWLLRVQAALHQVGTASPFLFYGTDWLAFGHFVIAAAFIGPLRDPVRNRWLFDFGIFACIAVIPYAMIFGSVRGIPFWWRLVDCSFGVLGLVPMWQCRRAALELERGTERNLRSQPGQ
jgi:hypothetical protein